MKNIIKVEDIKYIKLSKYKQLEKKKEKIKIKKEIKEVEKVVEKERDIKDYFILDPSNVCGIYPIKKGYGEFEELDTHVGLFKKLNKPQIKLDFNNFNKGEVITLNDSRYSLEYIDSMKKIASIWFSDKPEVFMVYDKEKKEFLKDHPLMLVFDWSIAFILAPRVETGEEE